MKVFGGTYDGTNRIIVASKTKKAAYEALCSAKVNTSYYHFSQQVCETGNEEEITVATSKSGTCFSKRANSVGDKFKEMEN